MATSLPPVTLKKDIWVDIYAETGIPVGGVLWVSDVLQRFESDTSGMLTSTSLTDSNFLSLCTATVEKVGGGADELDLAISINGATTGVAFDKSVASTENNNPTSLTSQRLDNISTGATIQAYVRNTDSNSNIIVSRCNLTMVNGF